MSEMVERVARAIEEKHDEYATGVYDRLGKDASLELARAAIEAMRKVLPSPACACLGPQKGHKLCYCDEAREWSRQIDAALK